MVETSARCSMIGSLCEESGATGIGTQLLLPHVVVTYVGVLAAAREDEAADATSSVVPLPRERGCWGGLISWHRRGTVLPKLA